MEALAYPRIISILDTDVYKLTMQQAVWRKFPNTAVSYRFTNRSKTMDFNRACFEALERSVSDLKNVSLQNSELEWLRDTCTFFDPQYLAYLMQFRFKPQEQVFLTFVPSSENSDFGQIEIIIRGIWVETILYEVPLMALLSEAYFRYVEKDWNYEGQEEQAYLKGIHLFENGILLSEFGSRRRRSYQSQDLVIRGLVRAHKAVAEKNAGRLSGTSNLHFAQKYGLNPVGTVAHEWFMGIAALQGYENANIKALQYWEDVYPANRAQVMLIALSDTFSSEVFFREFIKSPELVGRWRGLRQDSGDPINFIYQARDAYQAAGVDFKEKIIIFSDSLNENLCLDIKKVCDEVGFLAGFGMGTSLTNDFKSIASDEKSKVPNIVIKLSTIDGQPCVKLSDDLAKNTGDQMVVQSVKAKFELPQGNIEGSK